MEDKVNDWIFNFHLALVILLVVPVFFDKQNLVWLVLIISGLLTIIQCFHYISFESLPISDDKDSDNDIHRICMLSSLILVTWYLLLTGYWWCSPLYYVVMKPKNKKEAYAALFLPALGAVLVWFARMNPLRELLLLILTILIVLFITSVFYLIEKLMKRVSYREHMLTEQMKITSLNELKVKNLNRELAIKYQLADLNARLEERENIARNIHNVVGHTITSAIVSLQAYRVLQDSQPQRADEKLTSATERMRLALEEIRRAVRVLDQETQEISLKDFQQLMIAELMRFSMDTELKVSHNLNYLEVDQLVGKRYCEFLHSALTECLNNGIRHGNATSFLVYMQCNGNHIELSVTDNGTGFDKLTQGEQERRFQQGYGLKKMEQFVFEHGGKLRINAENGFSVHLELPLIHV